jgi:hypothetical protein
LQSELVVELKLEVEVGIEFAAVIVFGVAIEREVEEKQRLVQEQEPKLEQKNDRDSCWHRNGRRFSHYQDQYTERNGLIPLYTASDYDT